MDLRRLMLVFLVIIVVLASSFFFLNYDETVHYTRVSLTNTSSIEMPVTDQSTNTVINGGINLINDTQHDLTVMYFNSGDGNQVAAVEFEFIRNDFATSSVQETLGNQTIWHNEENGTYMAFIGNHVTHDNILIMCKDPEILEHMIASAQYLYFNQDTNSTETMTGENQSSVNSTNNTGFEELSTVKDLALFDQYDRIKNISTETQEVERKEYQSDILRYLPHPRIEPWLKESISQESMDNHGICFDPKNCGIVIPHFDINNRLVGIRERTLIKENEIYGKYRPALIGGQLYNHPLSFNLYNLNMSKNAINRNKKAFVFEGEKSWLLFSSYFGKENDM